MDLSRQALVDKDQPSTPKRRVENRREGTTSRWCGEESQQATQSPPSALAPCWPLLLPHSIPPLALPLFDFTRGCLGRCTSGRGRYVPYKLSASLEAMLRTGNGVSRRFQERKHRINFIERANVRAQAFANRGVHNCPPDVKGRSGRHRRTSTTTTTTSSTSVEACQRAVMAWDAAEVCLPGQVCAVVIISILTVFPLPNLLLSPVLSPLEVVMVVVVVVVLSLSLSLSQSLPPGQCQRQRQRQRSGRPLASYVR